MPSNKYLIKGRNAMEAIEFCIFWGAVVILTMLVNVVPFFFKSYRAVTTNATMVVITTLMRGANLFIVLHYMQELATIIGRSRRQMTSQMTQSQLVWNEENKYLLNIFVNNLCALYLWDLVATALHLYATLSSSLTFELNLIGTSESVKSCKN